MNVYAEWFLILLTWLVPVPPEPGVEATPIVIPLYRQEIPRKSESHCESTIKRLKRGWIKLPPDDPFKYALDCQLNPNFKPKGERK